MATTTTASAATAVPSRAVPPNPYPRRQLLEWVGLHSFAVALGLAFVLPFVFILLTALMSDQQSLTRDLWPNPFAWHNPVVALRTPPLATRSLLTIQIL